MSTINADGLSRRVALIYAFFPHYRAPVMRALARSSRYQFQFWGSVEKVEGIEPCPQDELVRINPLIYRNTRFGWRIHGYWKPVLSRDTKALIVLGNPNLLDTWLIALVGRALGKKVLFWTHGWLRKEPRFKAFVRNVYFALAHRVLTYGERARMIASRSGFPAERIAPIYNSLDWAKARAVVSELKHRDSSSASRLTRAETEPSVLICTARLTKLCRFDLLLQAMEMLKTRCVPTRLVLVGDGPERNALQEQAERLQLDVTFVGALYDEQRLGELLYAADITVSPGKVGLTAVHSLMYGTPVITHGNADAQMPEVEAVVPGSTGLFFQEGSAEDLAAKIETWLSAERDRDDVRARCRMMIETKYNPETQRQLIENALDNVLNVTTPQTVNS
ncbi:glycosyltransferase family 4 protein [Bradyrhizobium sp. BRP23]|uniref:glycosyltransferase family 4 protein n=1 Tax=Bradyrhizobium sp. BRP23 TaxID=2793820 RepID=UPI001CD4F8EA|nr:glycosyltransferase family 4 protein [Bradyrhizobium sp. BRP23]MCA1379281.1 glycosyltransferase family 4 protein [Bradyrhizobium sp. BRP05]MCA1420545.1 glycosyltransferase family 4 protein [Bradyrhizobium sp. BRP23]